MAYIRKIQEKFKFSPKFSKEMNDLKNTHTYFGALRLFVINSVFSAIDIVWPDMLKTIK